MKKIAIAIAAVLLLTAVAVPVSAAMMRQDIEPGSIYLSTVQRRKVVGMWGIGTDPEPVGSFKGFYIPAKSAFVGKIFCNGAGYYVGVRLNSGDFSGFILYNGNRIPVHGAYVVTGGALTAVWHCHGHSGWLIGQFK